MWLNREYFRFKECGLTENILEYFRFKECGLTENILGLRSVA